LFRQLPDLQAILKMNTETFHKPIKETSDTEDEQAPPQQQQPAADDPNHPANCLNVLKALVRDMAMQHTNDQQLIINLQQQQQTNKGLINQYAQTINRLRAELHNSINNPPAAAPPVVPAVAPAIVPIIALIIPIDNKELDLGRTLKVK
jgi:hypothetical protein